MEILLVAKMEEVLYYSHFPTSAYIDHATFQGMVAAHPASF
jgi:hypothetical protein